MAFLSGYTKRKKLTIDQTKIDTANLTNFPVLVKITADGDIGSVSNADGFDIRFTSTDGTTLLKYERESFAIVSDVANGCFWVKIPTVTYNADTEFYIYYRAIDTADGADHENAWDSNFKMVQHMKDNTTSSILDSTSNDNDGTKKAANQPIQTDGEIAKAQLFDYTNNEYINVADSASLDITSGITLETIWKSPASFSGGWLSWFMKQFWTNVGGDGSFGLMGHAALLRFVHNGLNSAYTDLAVSFDTNTVYHIAVTYQGDHVYFYVNGANVGNAARTGAILTNNYPCFLGSTYRASNTTFYYPIEGTLDEMRISNIGRNDSWMKASYNSGNNSLLTYGDEEEQGTNIKINIADNFKDVENIKINIGDSWKEVVAVKQNIGDTWKDVF